MIVLTIFTNKTDKMQPPMSVPSPTLGQYLFDCLKAEGITEIFGIPGDYNFSLLDTLEQYEGIRFKENTSIIKILLHVIRFIRQNVSIYVFTNMA